MKFTCQMEDLKKAVNAVSPAITAKPATPILGGIRVKADTDSVYLHGVNTPFTMVVKMPAEVDENGEILVNATRFVEFVRGSDATEVTISTDKDITALKIKAGKASFKLVMMKMDGFPAMPDVNDLDTWQTRFTIKQKDLATIIKQTAYAVATSNAPQPVYTGILCVIEKENLTIVGTNTRRMAIRNFPVNTGFERNTVIPVKVMTSAVKVGKDDEEREVLIAFHNNSVLVKNGDWMVVSQVLGDKFPDVRKVIPKDEAATMTFTCDRSELAGAIARMALVGEIDEGYSIITMEVTENKLKISASSREIGYGEEVVDCKTVGNDVKISFNANYWIDMLNNMPTDEVNVSIVAPLSPVKVSPVGYDDYTYVLTPIRTVG